MMEEERQQQEHVAAIVGNLIPPQGEILYLPQEIEETQNENFCYEMGNKLFERNLLKQATHCYRRVLQLHHQHLKSLLMLGCIELKMNRYQEAFAFFQRAEKINSQSFSIYALLGHTLTEQREQQKADVFFDKALQLMKPHYTIAFDQKREPYLKIDSSLQLEEVIKFQYLLSCAYAALGKYQGKKGQFLQQIAFLNKSIGLDPYNFKTYCELGRVYQKQKKYQKTADFLEIAMSLNLEGVLIFQGWDCSNAGDYIKARQYFNSAVHLNLNNSQARYGLGLVLLKTNHINLGLKHLKIASELGPSNAIICQNIADALDQNKFQKQTQTLIYSDTAPNLQKAHCFKEKYSFDNPYRQEAIKWYQKALNLKPRCQIFVKLGQTFMSCNKFKQASQCLRRALQMDKKNQQAALYLSLCSSVEDPENCFDNFRNLLENINSQNYHGYIRIGWLLMQRKNYQLAIKCFQKCISLQPKQLQAYNNLGLTFYLILAQIRKGQI